ncbi:Hypothetical_protein [Hexamita inflata]|uniref:Hypothetical_protein n=1 Tax=Hexamita inflata TaxID=28002 RepID=A0ABP1HGZ4_9EUKA
MFQTNIILIVLSYRNVLVIKLIQCSLTSSLLQNCETAMCAQQEVIGVWQIVGKQIHLYPVGNINIINYFYCITFIDKLNILLYLNIVVNNVRKKIEICTIQDFKTEELME